MTDTASRKCVACGSKYPEGWTLVLCPECEAFAARLQALRGGAK